MAMARGVQNIIQEKINKSAFQQKNGVRDILARYFLIYWLLFFNLWLFYNLVHAEGSLQFSRQGGKREDPWKL